MALLRPERLNGIHPDLAAFAKEAGTEWTRTTGCNVQLIWGYRSIAEQDALYAQGRTTKGSIVTHAKGGNSPHNYYCAIDIMPLTPDGKFVDWNNKAWPKFVFSLIKKYPTLVWGGSWVKFVDIPHIELKRWVEVKNGTLKF